MTFANVGVDREQLMILSQVLLSVFPGCTIHQSRDPMRAMQHLSTHKIDAMFMDEQMSSDWIRRMGDQGSKTSVYLLCRQDRPPKETGEIRGVVTYPVTTQKIRQALQTVSKEFREVI